MRLIAYPDGFARPKLLQVDGGENNSALDDVDKVGAVLVLV